MEEFTAYRLLYYVYMSTASAINVLLSDLEVSPLAQRPAIQHALAVRAAHATGNYHRFFKLYKVGTERTREAEHQNRENGSKYLREETKN